MEKVTAVVLGLVVAAGCARTDAQDLSMQPEPVSVRAVAVSEEEIARPIVATGTLGPEEEIALSFKTGGVIARIAVDAGDRVSAGQVLAELDTREINAAVSRARSAVEKAERDLARARRLFADSVVTLAQLQDAETAAEMARADLEAALFNRRTAVIVAPSAGVILKREAEAGETVAPGARVLLFGSRGGSVVRVGLADRDVVRVRVGDRATVRFDAYPGRTITGRVSEIGAAAQEATGTYMVEIAVQDVGDLASGLVGNVEIFPAANGRAVMVPIEAVLEADGDRATVFTLSQDSARAQRREVTVAFIDGDRVAISSGLESAASVITDGAAYLDDGTPVRVIQ